MPDDQDAKLILLTPRQVLALSSLFTQILLNPDNLAMLLNNPDAMLQSVGIGEDEIEAVEDYLLALKKTLDEKLAEPGDHWSQGQ
jgi:hypothetical protein